MDEAKVEMDLEKLRADVLERQARLAKKVEHREDPLPADFSEQAIELGNEETMLQLLSKTKVELVGIQQALDRLSSGNYTTCSECGGTIENARLEALPTTTLCIECSQRR